MFPIASKYISQFLLDYDIVGIRKIMIAASSPKLHTLALRLANIKCLYKMLVLFFICKTADILLDGWD